MSAPWDPHRLESDLPKQYGVIAFWQWQVTVTSCSLSRPPPAYHYATSTTGH